jgi:glyoxylase-like metal-dependent hydrolase (beta-lactamase superfamily II)
MKVKDFFHESTGTFTYVVSDPETGKCAVIDAVLDYDQYSGVSSTETADKVIEYIKNEGLENEWILETHIHADHISAASYLQNKIGGKTAIGSGIKDVLKTWVPIFNSSADTPTDSSQFDKTLSDNETFKIGNIEVKTLHTPGHTPACVSYQMEDSVFVGDTIFAPNLGTARVDFPGGDAATLYNSIQRLYQLPDETVLYLCHDYPAKGKDPTSSVNIADQKQNNIMLDGTTSLQDFVKKREARDKTLSVPKLLLPSIQANLRKGEFGNPEDNGTQYIKIPVNKI